MTTETQNDMNAMRMMERRIDTLAREIADRDRVITTLQRTLDEDPVTTTLSARAFIREAGRRLLAARRMGVSVTYLHFDIDGFQAINDRCGWHGGNSVLSHAATLLQQKMRAEDPVGRVGPDEFGVLLIDADRPAAEAKLAAIVPLIASQPVTVLSGRITVTVAAASVAWHAGMTIQNLIEIAGADIRGLRDGRRSA